MSEDENVQAGSIEHKFIQLADAIEDGRQLSEQMSRSIDEKEA